MNRSDRKAIGLLAESVLNDELGDSKFAQTLIQLIINGEVSDVGICNYIERQEQSVLEDFYEKYYDDDDVDVQKAIKLLRQYVDSGHESQWSDDGTGLNYVEDEEAKALQASHIDVLDDLLRHAILPAVYEDIVPEMIEHIDDEDYDGPAATKAFSECMRYLISKLEYYIERNEQI